jgi:hypothetical protein
LENSHIPSHHLNVQKAVWEFVQCAFLNLPSLIILVALDFSSNGIEWHHTYWTGCWPLSIILDIYMAAEVKRRLVCQVTGQCFDFITAHYTKLYSQNSLHLGGFAQLYMCMVWLHVHDFDTPISWDKWLKVFRGDPHILIQTSSNVHQLDTLLILNEFKH